MQQLLANIAPITWYFAFGAPEKTSLSIQFCRENGFEYYSNPTIEQLKKCSKHAIIEGTYQLFQQLQKIMPELSIIFFGTTFANQRERKIRDQYLSIGYCKEVPVLDHVSCRKALYPNLIFVYGPIQQQNYAAASTLARNLSYRYGQLPANPNNLIQSTDKCQNYIINGLFTQPSHIKILEQYFNLRIIHFKYNREDLPKHSAFFDDEQDLTTFLKDKQYYFQIKGDDDPVLIMDNVGLKLCPRLVYVNYQKEDADSLGYIKRYVEETDGLVLSIYNIQHIRKRKGLPIPRNEQGKTQRINQILYKDLNRKQIILTDFPWHTPEFINLQNYNRKISYFIDLIKPQKYAFSKEYSSPIYFLQNQTRISPSFDLSLKEELNNQVEYWVVNGPGTCGKTSIAKYVASEFGFKLIQFQAEAAAAKEKVAKPEDGEEVPVHRYVTYFANIIKSNPQNTYIFDSLPYTNADLQLWVKQVGCPNVINLKADPNQLIKRMRKKAESDVNAQITEEQTTKVNENLQKNTQWVQKLGQYGPSSKIYQVDCNLPLILTQPHINSILKPRIFLVQKNNHITYQNIAIKYNMGFINLMRVPLRECAALVRKCGKRDVILCYYGQSEEKLICEDMYWIEKYLGEIRYLGIWEPEQTEIKEKMMKLERPPEPVKPKPAQGQQQKQEAVEAEGEQGKPKKVFDIYSYQWSQPVSHKNLSQWYFKLKTNIKTKNSDPKSCYNTFQQILTALNKDRTCNFYEIIK